MRIELTSNRNVYNCVSVVQEQQPSFPAGYSSSSRITSNLISRIIQNKSINNTSSLSTNNTTTNNDVVANHGVLSQQQQQQVETVEGHAGEYESSKRRLQPFEVSSSSLSQSADSSGHSGDAFLPNDKNDDYDSSGRNGDRHVRGWNIPGNNDDDTCDDKHDGSNQDGHQRPSNEKLLGTAFMSFMTFSLIQLCFAFIAGSQAMKGDSAAMIVDSMTYLSNWIAEKKKSTFDQTYIPPPATPTPFVSSLGFDPDREAKRVKERARRKMVLTLEIVPPLISVSALIGITIVVLKQAIRVLLMDRYRLQADQTDPNIHVMLAFSTCNLGLDALNVFCFAKAKHLMGFQTRPQCDHPHHSSTSTTVTLYMGDLNSNGGGGDSENRSSNARRTSGSYLVIEQTYPHDDDDDDDDGDDGRNNMPTLAKDERGCDSEQQNGLDHVDLSRASEGDPAVVSSTARQVDDHNERDESSHDDGEEANLNMCSAYTHVFADTLRSIAVIIATIIALIVKSVTPEEADASAAVVVSILILLSLIPLFQGLKQSLDEFFAIRAEEQSEQMFASTSNSAAAVSYATNEVV